MYWYHVSRNGPKLTVRHAESVAEEATVRHVDQLSERARADFLALIAGERRSVPDLDIGEVVVHTSYYRVVGSGRTRWVADAAASDGGVKIASDGGERSTDTG